MPALRDPLRGLRECAAAGCDRADHTAGLCGMHYQRKMRGSRLDGFDAVALGRQLAKVMPCVAHGCDQPIQNFKRGVCSVHHNRLRENNSYALRGREHLRLPRIAPTEKRCSRCGEVKPAETFAKSSRARDGLTGHCYPCKTADSRERNYRIRTKYGISNGDYLAMVEAQGGRCAICGEHPDPARQHAKLYIDHCHDSGKVRGLLCHGCNVGIGWMQDQPERLDAAAAYLRERG